MAEERRDAPHKLSDEDLAVAFSGPAPGVNRFFITTGPSGLRIAFAEQEPTTGRAHFRAAVTMHPFDAIQLQRMLKTMMSLLEPMYEEAIQGESGE